MSRARLALPTRMQAAKTQRSRVLPDTSFVTSLVCRTNARNSNWLRGPMTSITLYHFLISRRPSPATEQEDKRELQA
jgi:hypothetical protein